MAETDVQYCATPDGYSIAYAVEGNGPPVVRVSGMPTHLTLEDRSGGFSRSLRDCTMVRYDGRCCGLSQRTPLDFSLNGRVTDLESVVDRLGIERFALFANAFACPAAIEFALRFPERVSHLVLLRAFASPGRVYELSPAFRFNLALQDVTEDQWEFVTLTMATRSQGPDPAAVARFAELFRASVTPQGLIAYRDANREIDLTDRLPDITTPTLVIGNDSDLIPIQLAQDIAARIPGARYRIDPSGNFEPDPAVVAAIREFIGLPPLSEGRPKGESTGAFRTVLFTDLVGHTEMMQRLGDERGRDVLREHERITREVLKAHGGTEIKTDGDSFMVSFGSATEAVECAIALQRAFADRDGEPLAIRVGLNAGEPIAEDNDLFGATVILASRIADKAGPGEILIPEPVRHLLAGKAFSFADRGEFVPKGFDDAVRLYEVRWRE